MIKSILRKVFKRKAIEVPNMYDFRTISVDEVGKFPDGLKSLKSREIDGFIIKGLLTPEEVQKIDDFTRSFGKNKDQVLYTKKGFVYPLPFSAAGAECPDVEKYFTETKRIRSGFAQECGVDIEEKLFDVLSKMAGGRKVSTPDYKQEMGSATPFTLRYLNEINGVVEVHCGNLFHGNHSKFYEHANTVVDSFDQLSFFFMIQPSESSDLVLLDRVWKDGQKKTNFDNYYTFTDENSKEVDCSEFGIDRMTIRLEPGDFLTFAGGPIWHVVEKVKGTKGRITVGGFMGFSHDDKTVYSWS